MNDLQPSGHVWPVVLCDGQVMLRPLRQRDARLWREVRSLNADWLAPWESTHPDETSLPPTFRQMVRSFWREARTGRMLPFVIEVDGALVGQINVSGITWGSLRSAHIGYWIDRRMAGRGIVPTAVAMATDHCFFQLGLHRVELNIRPENRASLRVAHKLGFRPEGMRHRYLHIDGAWRDHLTFALTADEVPDGLMVRWRTIAADLYAERASGSSGSVTDSSATHRC